MDWIEKHCYKKHRNLICLDDLKDVTVSPTPSHGGDIVFKCLKCREIERSLTSSRSDKQRKILGVLKKAKNPMTGKEIARGGFLEI